MHIREIRGNCHWKNGRKITWSCRETPTSIKTTYYKSKDGVLTNAENADALTEGGAPAAKGDYYVKAELTFREKVQIRIGLSVI